MDIFDKKIFEIEDADGGVMHIGMALYQRERIAELPEDTRDKFPTRRCAMFKVVNDKYEYSRKFKYIVAVIFSDKRVVNLEKGEWVDAKAISGYATVDLAKRAFENFGAEYLEGNRINWSVIKRVK